MYINNNVYTQWQTRSEETVVQRYTISNRWGNNVQSIDGFYAIIPSLCAPVRFNDPGIYPRVIGSPIVICIGEFSICYFHYFKTNIYDSFGNLDNFLNYNPGLILIE